jgi:Zn-dependent peptidase ImmA (M78 family)
MDKKAVKFVPEVLQWARERASLDISFLARKLNVTAGKVVQWETTGELSLSMAKKLASATRTPLGYLFLAEPLSDKLPIPDFRTVKDAPFTQPSPDLLETIHCMQLRQDWMRDFLTEEGAEKLGFVASATITSDPVDIAHKMRSTLDVTAEWAKSQRTWEDALRHLREKIELSGVLIFLNGVVGNNTRRKLDPQEFRGFALCDEYAPLIFINGTDSKSAKMFTMVHELAHIWLGKNGVSNTATRDFPTIAEEKFCNAVAAEFLVPQQHLKTLWSQIKNFSEPYLQIAKHFKVSPIVAARRCQDLRLIDKQTFFSFYDAYMAREHKEEMQNKGGGGDFWNTQNVRIGVRFGTAIVIAAKEGKLPFRDAYRLTGLSGSSFETYSKSIGMPIV